MRASNLILTVLMLLQLIAVVPSAAKAGLIINDDALYIALGATYSNVGWIEGTNSTNTTSFLQSGVLIDRNWVLASAHGVLEIDNNPASMYRNLRVGFTPNYLTTPGESQVASKVFIEPSYRDVGRGYDLALLYFDTPFTTVAPIERYLDDIAVGMDSYLVGYGNVQTAGQAAATQVFTGDRRAGNNVISSTFIVSRPEYVRTTIRSDAFPDFYRELQMGGTPGDSGGALIINGRLAGTTSFVGGDGFGALTGYSRLNNVWIDATIAAQAVPEPSTYMLLTSAFAILLVNRKRKIARIQLPNY